MSGRGVLPSRYVKGQTFTSFSGADIIASITIQGKGTYVIGSLQTISYSVFRPTSPVHALGQIGPKGVVRGARTIAGTMIFTVFDRHVLYDVMTMLRGTNMTIDGINCPALERPMLSDEIPAFDVTISFMNEYGQSSKLVIYGVHLMSEGQTMSIEDMITENVIEYIAMDVDAMIPDAFIEPQYNMMYRR